MKDPDSCALDEHGQLKDAANIVWIHVHFPSHDDVSIPPISNILSGWNLCWQAPAILNGLESLKKQPKRAHHQMSGHSSEDGQREKWQHTKKPAPTSWRSRYTTSEADDVQNDMPESESESEAIIDEELELNEYDTMSVTETLLNDKETYIRKKWTEGEIARVRVFWKADIKEWLPTY